MEKIQYLLEDDHTDSGLCGGALNRSADVHNWKVWTERVRLPVSDVYSKKSGLQNGVVLDLSGRYECRSSR